MPKQSNGGLFRSFFREHTCLGFFAILRIYVGYTFLMAGWSKYQTGYLNPSLQATPLLRPLTVWLDGRKPMPEGWYRSFLESYVLPNAHLFGILVTAGELIIGLLLLVGLLSRLAAFIGVFMSLNFLFASGHVTASGMLTNQLFTIVGILLVLTGAGRAWGVDWYLKRVWPRSPFW